MGFLNSIAGNCGERGSKCEGGLERYRVRCLRVCNCSGGSTVLNEKCSACSQMSNVFHVLSTCIAWLYERPSSRRCVGESVCLTEKQ